MKIQTTTLEEKLDSLEEKAEKYDTRTNTEQRVERVKSDLEELNRTLQKLKVSLDEFERQTRILTDVFGKSLPSEATDARNEVRSLIELSQEDILDIIDGGNRSLSEHTDDVREAQETVTSATRTVNNKLRDIRKDKISDAKTAESIQRIVGEDRDATNTISRYKMFLNSILNPNDSVSTLRSQWQGLENAFKDLDTDWEGFQEQHSLSDQTIENLKTLSREDKMDLDDLTVDSITEMMEIPELRSTIKVSI